MDPPLSVAVKLLCLQHVREVECFNIQSCEVYMCGGTLNIEPAHHIDSQGINAYICVGVMFY